jgi:hypothetical protein
MLGAVGVSEIFTRKAQPRAVNFCSVFEKQSLNDAAKNNGGIPLRVNISLMAKASLSRWSCAGDLLNSTVETQNREKTCSDRSFCR